MAATYDAIADWYEDEFLGDRSDDGLPIGDPIGVDSALSELLGHGVGTCLEIGCGTGTHAARVRSLGRVPIGIDISAGMLRHARSRLPIVRANGEALPFPDASFSSVLAVMIHTDVEDYSAVIREASRVLAPGGCLVHIGVHPCFCGGFADRSDSEAIVIRPGYLDGHWTLSISHHHPPHSDPGPRLSAQHSLPRRLYPYHSTTYHSTTLPHTPSNSHRRTLS